MIEKHIINYRTPREINSWWNYGLIAGMALGIQIGTGVMLTMTYKGIEEKAMESVIKIMREVRGGWWIRYMHSNMASMLFMVVYIHMIRGMYYELDKRKAWKVGIIIYIMMMGTALMGYVLPWGQMSIWGATVITSLVTVIPIIGEEIVRIIWGGYTIGETTLNRFYSIHYIMPMIILGMVGWHISVIHKEGTSGKRIKGITRKTGWSLYENYNWKDIIGVQWILIIVTWIITKEPNRLGNAENNEPANSMKTPRHIVPEWYFLPYYAILRSVPWKTGGVILMVLSIILLGRPGKR